MGGVESGGFSEAPRRRGTTLPRLVGRVVEAWRARRAEAVVALQYVIHEYPGSDEARLARQRLTALGVEAR